MISVIALGYSSGGSRISRWGGRRAVGGALTSGMGAFWRKHMQKRKNWILLGGHALAAPPWIRQCTVP